jgi:hypothetical protein
MKEKNFWEWYMGIIILPRIRKKLKRKDFLRELVLLPYLLVLLPLVIPGKLVIDFIKGDRKRREQVIGISLILSPFIAFLVIYVLLMPLGLLLIVLSFVGSALLAHSMQGDS